MYWRGGRARAGGSDAGPRLHKTQNDSTKNKHIHTPKHKSGHEIEIHARLCNVYFYSYVSVLKYFWIGLEMSLPLTIHLIAFEYKVLNEKPVNK